jgi:hypothetical protein
MATSKPFFNYSERVKILPFKIGIGLGGGPFEPFFFFYSST